LKISRIEILHQGADRSDTVAGTSPSLSECMGCTLAVPHALAEDDCRATSEPLESSGLQPGSNRMALRQSVSNGHAPLPLRCTNELEGGVALESVSYHTSPSLQSGAALGLGELSPPQPGVTTVEF
jgi:hypothetical protein